MLKVISIKKSFRSPVLRSVNLSLNEGTILALMGPNGAGKTTLLKILATIILPDAGNITIDDIDIIKHPYKAKAITGFVFSNERSFYMRLSGMDNLKFFFGFYNIERKIFFDKLHYYINELKFPEKLLMQPVIEYSSGEKQLLSIIRSFIHAPKYLFIDEPSISLDEEHRRKMFSLIKKEVSNDKAAIVVTHSTEEARALTDNIGKLENGVIQYDKG